MVLRNLLRNKDEWNKWILLILLQRVAAGFEWPQRIGGN